MPYSSSDVVKWGYLLFRPEQLRAFAEDPAVKQSFVSAVFALHSVGPSKEKENTNIPKSSELSCLEVPRDWKQLNAHGKRKLVIALVTNNGTTKPYWNESIHRPTWWPQAIPFVDPNNGKQRPTVKMLSTVIAAYCKHIQSCHADSSGSKSDDASDSSTDTTGSLLDDNPENFASDKEDGSPLEPGTVSDVSDSEEDDLHRRLLSILADETFIRRMHHKMDSGENKTALRLLYYPAVDGQLKEGQVRCGEHSDYGTITFLFQDSVGGLEVCSRQGEFVPARPIEGTILVNIGDLLQRWTNNMLVSTRHRVGVPQEESLRSVVRHSAAFFVHPNDNAVIECLDGSDNYPPIINCP